jgi:hypothetical protein
VTKKTTCNPIGVDLAAFAEYLRLTMRIQMLESALAQSPPLPKALCIGRASLFDAATEDDAQAAAELCRRCPELPLCEAWAAALPPNTVTGVVAGEHRTYDE